MHSTPFQGDCHACTHFGTRSEIRQYRVILFARAPLGTLFLGQRAVDAHYAGAAVLPVLFLVGAAPSARREGTLVPEAEFAMFCALTAAMAAHLTIG